MTSYSRSCPISTVNSSQVTLASDGGYSCADENVIGWLVVVRANRLRQSKSNQSNKLCKTPKSSQTNRGIRVFWSFNNFGDRKVIGNKNIVEGASEVVFVAVGMIGEATSSKTQVVNERQHEHFVH